MTLLSAAKPTRYDASLCTDGVLNWSVQWLGLILSLSWLVTAGHQAATGDSAHPLISLTFAVSNALYFSGALLFHAFESRSLRFFMYRMDRASIFLLLSSGTTCIYLTHMLPSLGWAPLISLWGASATGAFLAFKEGFPWKSNTSKLVFYATFVAFVYRAAPLVAGAVSPAEFLRHVAATVFFSLGILFFERRSHRTYRLIWTCAVIASATLLSPDVLR